DLMPFVFYKGTASKSLQNALSEYAKTVSEHSLSYLDELKSCIQEGKEIKEDIQKILDDLSVKEKRIDAYHESLFKEDGFEDELNKLATELTDKSSQVEELYNDIFKKEGIKERITLYLADADTDKKSISSLKKSSSEMIDELKEFHTVILGEENEEGEREGGLKNEINIRRKELDDFKIMQQERYKELNNQIESLLPGATSAGLAKAYSEMKKSFSRAVITYGCLFYVSLAFLLAIICAVYYIPVYFGFPELSLGYVISNLPKLTALAVDGTTEAVNLTGNIAMNTSEPSVSSQIFIILKSLVFKLSFILPALWLVLFVSKRRNEARRLEQEYAHKEALAKSYDSYKQQIEKLKQEDQDKLLSMLMENMLKAIALNPAETLDKNHKDPMPIEEVMNRKEIWNILDKFKDLVTPKKS
ncbi:TPA: hypothetical protein QB471_001291, partial [Pasteurella multocida]|nr:hypothetical protein [Pasteurella multocida]